MNHISAGKYLSLKKMADANGHLRLFSIEHHAQIETRMLEVLQLNELPDQAMRELKSLILRSVSSECSGIIVDPIYSLNYAITQLDNNIGVGVAIDSELYDTSTGAEARIITKMMPNWGVSKVKRLGVNIVQVSLQYDPATDSLSSQQQRDLLREIGQQCNNHDIALILRLEVARQHDSNSDDDIAQASVNYLKALDIFRHSDYGVDIFAVDLPLSMKKLPNAKTGSHRQVSKAKEVFQTINSSLEQGWVIFCSDIESSHNNKLDLVEYAMSAGACGYMMGNPLWWSDFDQFPNIHRMGDSLLANGVELMEDINKICSNHQNPWYQRSYYTTSGQRARPHNIDSRYFPSLYPKIRVEGA